MFFKKPKDITKGFNQIVIVIEEDDGITYTESPRTFPEALAEACANHPIRVSVNFLLSSSTVYSATH